MQVAKEDILEEALFEAKKSTYLCFANKAQVPNTVDAATLARQTIEAAVAAELVASEAAAREQALREASEAAAAAAAAA